MSRLSASVFAKRLAQLSAALTLPHEPVVEGR